MKKNEWLTIIVLNFLLIVLAFNFLKSVNARSEELTIRNFLKIIAHTISIDLENTSFSKFEILDKISKKTGVLLTVFEKNGQLIYPSRLADSLQVFKKFSNNLISEKQFWKEDQHFFFLTVFKSGDRDYYLGIAKNVEIKPMIFKMEFLLLLITLVLINLYWLKFLQNREKTCRIVRQFAGKEWNLYETDQINLKRLFSLFQQKESDLQPELLENIFHLLPIIIFLTDENGKIIFSSHQATEKFGFQPQKEFWQVLRSPQLLALFNESSEKRKNNECDIIVDGIKMKIFLKPLKNRNILVIMNEQKQSESEKQREFLLSLAHELRTPLTALKGFTETLDEDPENLSNYKPILLRQINRMIEMVESILKWQSVEQPPQIEEIEINNFFKELIPIFNKQATQKGLQFEFTTNCQDKKISTDRYLLEQLCFIFFDNALKFTQEGKISLNLDCSRPITITFRDSGCGFDRKLRDRIFEPFFVADKSRSRPYSGCGLGLTIARKICQKLGIKIEVDSELSKGSEFRLIFSSEN